LKEGLFGIFIELFKDKESEGEREGDEEKFGLD